MNSCFEGRIGRVLEDDSKRKTKNHIVKDLEKPPTLLLVDDESSILDYIGLGLKYEKILFCRASSCAEGRKVLQEREIDLVVLDRMLGDGDGLELCQYIRARYQIPILMLSALGQVEDRVEGLNSGADDYLAKPFEFAELLARIRALLRRSSGSAESSKSEEISSGPLRLSIARRRVYLSGEEMSLTPKEFDLLHFFVSHEGRVFSKEDLVSRLWGDNFDGFTSTVEVHVSALRQKLGPEHRQKIRTVRGVGYAWDL